MRMRRWTRPSEALALSWCLVSGAWTLVGHRRFSGARKSQVPGAYSQRSSPIVLIQRGDWRGSESIWDLST